MNCREKVHIASCTYIVMVGQKFAHILNTWTARALKWVVIDRRRIVILSYLLPLTFLTRIRNHYVDLKILTYLFCPPTLTIVLYFFYLSQKRNFILQDRWYDIICILFLRTRYYFFDWLYLVGTQGMGNTNCSMNWSHNKHKAVQLLATSTIKC